MCCRIVRHVVEGYRTHLERASRKVRGCYHTSGRYHLAVCLNAAVWSTCSKKKTKKKQTSMNQILSMQALFHTWRGLYRVPVLDRALLLSFCFSHIRKLTPNTPTNQHLKWLMWMFVADKMFRATRRESSVWFLSVKGWVGGLWGLLFDCVIKADRGTLDRKGEWRKKKGAGSMERVAERERERERKWTYFLLPPELSSDELAVADWWHVVWKAISSAICVSVLPMVRGTLRLPGSKSLSLSLFYFLLCFVFFRLLLLSDSSAYTHPTLPVCSHQWFIRYKHHFFSHYVSHRLPLDDQLTDF